MTLDVRVERELIYSDFANRWSIELSCENKSVVTKVQLSWKLGEKNPKQSKIFVGFQQKLYFFGLRDLQKNILVGFEYVKSVLLKLDIPEII